jgi:hypothetical protein
MSRYPIEGNCDCDRKSSMEKRSARLKIFQNLENGDRGAI